MTGVAAPAGYCLREAPAGRVLGLAGPARLAPVFAVALARPVPPGAPPGAVRQSFGAVFAGLAVAGTGVVLGDRVVEPGPVALWTSPAGDCALRCGPEDFGDLAAEVARLAPGRGDLVVVPARAVPFTPPGVVQLWGPGDAVLTVRFDARED